MSGGRNEPCPCGSGKKYKKCCLEKDEAASLNPERPYMDLEERLSDEVDRYFARRFPEQFKTSEEEYPVDFTEEHHQIPLFLEWNLYERKVDGRPAVDWYLEDRGRNLAGHERAWLRAQLAAWVGIWEVLSVESKTTVRMQDRLTGEERLITSTLFTENISPGEAFLGRMIDYEGVSLILSPHPYSLTPIEAHEVLQTIRQDLELPKPTTPAHLREGETSTALIDYWDQLFDDDVEDEAPQLCTTDGDPMQLIEDSYQLVGRGARAAVETNLPKLLGIHPPEDGDASRCFRQILLNPDRPSMPPTVHANIYVRPRSLLVTTASVRRADAVRDLLAKAFPEIVRFKERVEEDFQKSMTAMPSMDGEGPEMIEVPEADEAILSFKRNFYSTWHKESLPALDGLTPEEAATQPQYRGKLDALLKDMAMSEARLLPGQRYDFDEIRKILGL